MSESPLFAPGREPVVAIIGRPNVGKSSLFNRVIGERLAIEEPTEGVTRDRLMRRVELKGRPFVAVDTGGIGVVDRQALEASVEEQIAFAIGGADMVIFVVDGSVLPTDLDHEVAKRLRKTGIPCMLLANKVDNDQLIYEAARYSSLGFGEPVFVSVIHNRGLNEFKAKLASLLPDGGAREGKKKEGLRIAFAGRRNVGKSSLTNLLCGQNRVIVSDVAGTTRDAVDVTIEREGKTYTIIDTAGLRKKKQTEDGIEFYSIARTYGALIRSDIVFFMIDAEAGVSQVDIKLAAWIQENYRPCILVINKWDLAEGIEIEKYSDYLSSKLPGLNYAPVVAISVKDNDGIQILFELVKELTTQMKHRPTTPQINKVMEELQKQKRPDRVHNVQPKLFYATMLDKTIPTFLIFGKKTKAITDRYTRYMRGYMRHHLGMPNMPIRLVFRERDSKFAPEGEKGRRTKR